jgi:hypothetical protein
MRHLLTAVVAVFVVACGGDGGSTGPSPTVDLNGTWQFQTNTSNSVLEISCQTTGTVVVNHSGNNFTGQVTGGEGTCSSPEGIIEVTPEGSLTGGQISGEQVSFNDGECVYSGRMSGNPVNRISGNNTCTIAVGGTNYTFTGTWQVSR